MPEKKLYNVPVPGFMRSKLDNWFNDKNIPYTFERLGDFPEDVVEIAYLNNKKYTDCCICITSEVNTTRMQYIMENLLKDYNFRGDLK